MFFHAVIPAKAGIQCLPLCLTMDSRHKHAGMTMLELLKNSVSKSPLLLAEPPHFGSGNWAGRPIESRAQDAHRDDA